MRCFLATFDQAHRTVNGSYWTWHHATLPPNTLDAFYYNYATKHWPDDAQPIPEDVLRGGCAGVDNEWIAWYRFVDGGRDKAGRPGRYVLLVAFIRRDNHHGWNWSGVLDSQVFQQLARQARVTCPIPAPDDLAMDWQPSPVEKRSAAAECLFCTGHQSLDIANDLTILGEVCSTVPLGSELDCFANRENGITMASFVLFRRPDLQPSAFLDCQSPIKSDGLAPIPKSRETMSHNKSPLTDAKWRSCNKIYREPTLAIGFIISIAIGIAIGWHLRGVFDLPEPLGRDVMRSIESRIPNSQNKGDAVKRDGPLQIQGSDAYQLPSNPGDSIRKH